jgi:hypothetical protein
MVSLSTGTVVLFEAIPPRQQFCDAGYIGVAAMATGALPSSDQIIAPPPTSNPGYARNATRYQSLNAIRMPSAAILAILSAVPWLAIVRHFASLQQISVRVHRHSVVRSIFMPPRL